MQFHQNMEIYCIDTWQGGAEHIGRHDMNEAEMLFNHNMTVAAARFPSAQIQKNQRLIARYADSTAGTRQTRLF